MEELVLLCWEELLELCWDELLEEFADEFPLLPWLPHADPPKKLGHCQLVPQHKGEPKKQKGPGGVHAVLLVEEFVLLCREELFEEFVEELVLLCWEEFVLLC